MENLQVKTNQEVPEQVPKMPRRKVEPAKKGSKGVPARVKSSVRLTAADPSDTKEKQFEIEVQEGWGKVTLELLAKVLGTVRLVDLKQVDKVRGKFKIVTSSSGLTRILRSLKELGIRAVRG